MAEDLFEGLVQQLDLGAVDTGLLRHAFRHASYVAEHDLPPTDSNQRLEFLGDAVLDVVLAERLYRAFPHLPEGELTKLKSALVRSGVLSQVAREHGLGALLLLGKGEEDTGGRRKASLLADALEALIGAVYLGGGMEAAARLVTALFEPRLEQLGAERPSDDFKSRLQEKLQQLAKAAPTYVTVDEQGPAHARLFRVQCRFRGTPVGEGSGRSKRDAEQRAAEAALSDLAEWWARMSPDPPPTGSPAP